MDVREAVYNRRSIRKFRDIPVPWDLVGRVADAGRIAPTAGNVQPCRFIVVRDEGKRKKIASAAAQQYWIEQAPVCIVIIADEEACRRFYQERGQRYAMQDAAMAAMQMQLTAHALGLGTTFVSAYDEEIIKDTLTIPDTVSVQGILPLGYPAEEPESQPRYQIENVVWLEKYDGRIADVDRVLWNFRIAEKATKYVKESFHDLKRVTRDSRQSLHKKVKDSAKKLLGKRK